VGASITADTVFKQIQNLLKVFCKGGGSACVYPEYVVCVPAVPLYESDGNLGFSGERVKL